MTTCRVDYNKEHELVKYYVATWFCNVIFTTKTNICFSSTQCTNCPSMTVCHWHHIWYG